jgi:hypothetical protein
MRHGFPRIVILCCFGALFLICYAPALFRDRQFGYRDAGNYYYPLNKRVQAEWNAGRFPLWEPEENAGMPLLGNPTAAVFYPGKLVFALLPYAWAARTYIVMHTALAYLSMLVLMRAWGTSLYGSALSALSYAFCAPILFQTCNIIYLIGAAWLPLGIHAVDGWVRLGRRWCLLELAIVLSMQVLGGELQSAYLLGVAGIGYAACLAWNRAKSSRDRPDRARWGPVRIASSLPVIAVVLVACWASTLAVANWIPNVRSQGHPAEPLRWAAWVPVGVSIAWALVAVGALVQWRRRGSPFPLTVMWLGLAGSAALAVALTAVQLFPVIEFTQQTGRASARPDEVYNYSIDPYQMIELAWPNFLGAPFGSNDYWQMNVPTPGVRHSVWVPSLYLGGMTVALAFGSLTIKRGPPWRIWMTVVAAIAMLASLGHFTSPIWLTRALSVATSSSALHNWLPDLGPLDTIESTSIRSDGRMHDSDGSAYWWLSTLLPGFRQFRYPAKLFTFVALALAVLAGLGWDRLGRERSRAVTAVFSTLLILTLAGLAVVIFRREPIIASFRGLTSPSLFGPFEPLAAYRTIVASLGQSLIVLTLGLFLTLLVRKHPQTAGTIALVALTADLAAANSRFVLTVPQALFEARSEVNELIANAERADPSPGPFRVYRMWQWYPMRWFDTSSRNRIDETLIWDRDTLYPKFGIDLGLAYTHTGGVGELADYERFFIRFSTKINDPQAAEHLDVKPGESVIYLPRRGFDVWNTRYFIVAYAANGWRDPPRAHASFLFQSRQIYPDPAQFTGPQAAENAQNWAESRDFKVLKNLVVYPRSWVVHAARAARPIANSQPDQQADTIREILYAADPLWNYGTERVFDPHVVAWLSRSDLAQVRPYLSGLPPGPHETVTVTYPSPQQAALEVDLESPGLVILSDVYYWGWELTIDGSPAPVYRVNGSMRGAAVSSGHHRLVYTFRPLLFRIGGLVSIAGLAVLIVLGWAYARSPLDPLLAGDEHIDLDAKNVKLQESDSSNATSI